MATGINPYTAIAIYDEIQKSPEVKTQELGNKLKLNVNTVRIYCRHLAKIGCIRISKTQSSNAYVPIKTPPEHLPDIERLQQIQDLLLPWANHPGSWDKQVKSEIIEAIQQAIRLTASGVQLTTGTSTPQLISKPLEDIQRLKTDVESV